MLERPLWVNVCGRMCLRPRTGPGGSRGFGGAHCSVSLPPAPEAQACYARPWPLLVSCASHKGLGQRGLRWPLFTPCSMNSPSPWHGGGTDWAPVCLELARGCHLPVCTDPWDAWPHWLGTPCPGSSLSSPQTRAVALSPCAPRPRDTSHYPIVRSHVCRAGQRWAPQLSEACSHPRAARQACVSWGSPVAPTHSLWGPSRCWRKGSPWQQRLCPFTALTLAPKAVWRRAQR